MEITVSTDKIRLGGISAAKSLLLVVFSAGSLFPLAGVLLIPALILESEFEFESTQISETESHAAPNDNDFVQDNRLRLNRLASHRHNLAEFRITVIVLCVWLAAVVAYWSWKWNRALTPRATWQNAER